MTDDAELLRRYADEKSEDAFAELVRRHLGLVYHAALRQCGGDAHRAQDVAQTVFADVARKARSLARRPALAGWLHTSTRYAAAQAVRGEVRRQRREQEAHAMNEILAKANGDDAAAEWERMRPVIDEALHALGERDRDAVLARFFEGRAFAEIGARLALSEDAARMRVERALEKLRVALGKRGITSTAAALALALANQAGAAVPAGLAASVTGAALAEAVGGVTFAGKLMSMMTHKGVMGGAVALTVIGGVLLGWRANHGAGAENEAVSLLRDPAQVEQRPGDRGSRPEGATAVSEPPRGPAAEEQKRPGDFSISGSVKRPGRFSVAPGGSVPLTQVITQAGGLAERANSKKVRVSRTQADGTAKVFTLDLERSGDFAVEAGDVVYVPERII